MRSPRLFPMEVASIILRTDDVERSTTFWSQAVGLAITDQYPDFTFLDGGSVTLIISAIDRPIADESLTEIVLMTEEVRETYADMAARGVPFESALGQPIMSQEGRDLIAAHFQDPDGHYGRLTGWVASD